MIKDIKDLPQYFPDYVEDQLPSRLYLFAILSTKRSEVINEFVRQARSNRSIKIDEEKKNFIEVEPLLLQEIEGVYHQKCKWTNWINESSNQRKSKVPIEKIDKDSKEEKATKGVSIGFVCVWEEKGRN